MQNLLSNMSWLGDAVIAQNSRIVFGGSLAKKANKTVVAWFVHALDDSMFNLMFVVSLASWGIADERTQVQACEGKSAPHVVGHKPSPIFFKQLFTPLGLCPKQPTEPHGGGAHSTPGGCPQHPKFGIANKPSPTVFFLASLFSCRDCFFGKSLLLQ